MTTALPPLPDRTRLADLCRETAAKEKVQPDLVEKDFYLTRLLWALGTHFGQKLLLKGGTLLSKVDLGFFRMSEDADMVMPAESMDQSRGVRVRQLNRVRDALKALEDGIGVRRRLPGGEVHDQGSRLVWQLDYPSEFGLQSIQLEASLRLVRRPSRKVALKQLLSDPLVGDYRQARCWALDPDEARAEKVRAACTREAIRDFYDLDRYDDLGADFTSKGFVDLVDVKLAEVNAPALGHHEAPFALTERRKRALRAGLSTDLPAVLKSNAPVFDLDRMLKRFEQKWPKGK